MEVKEERLSRFQKVEKRFQTPKLVQLSTKQKVVVGTRRFQTLISNMLRKVCVFSPLVFRCGVLNSPRLYLTCSHHSRNLPGPGPVEVTDVRHLRAPEHITGIYQVFFIYGLGLNGNLALGLL